MKKNLEVLGVDETKDGRPLKTKNGKPYFRVKTSGLQGTELKWLSCFDMDMLEITKKFLDKTACFEIRQSGEYFNIDSCLGSAQEIEEEAEDIQVVKVTNKGLVPVETKVSRNTTMYTSYAKDVFVALNTGKLGEERHLMDLAINLVKQAKEAFS